jgi:hypothetical protein
MSDKTNKDHLDINSNLRSFFYEKLVHFNQKVSTPLPESMVFYSSEVLEKYAVSNEFFESKEGKLTNKVLGLNYLQASSSNTDQQIRELKDVGDMALILCGYFVESIDKKIISPDYYKKVGQSAYRRLDKISPKCLDIPQFFFQLSEKFDEISRLLGLLALDTKNINDSHYIFDLYAEEQDKTHPQVNEASLHKKNFKKAN